MKYIYMLSGTVVSERPKQRERIDHRLSHLGGSSQDNDDEVWMAQQGPTLKRGQPGPCMSEVTAPPSKHVIYSLCNICSSFPELLSHTEILPIIITNIIYSAT